MRELIYPHCMKCDCPLVHLTGERPHKLCMRCHESMAANSTRNPNACRCGYVSTCSTCRQREWKYKFNSTQKQHIRKYDQDYYYENYEEQCERGVFDYCMRRAKEALALPRLRRSGREST